MRLSHEEKANLVNFYHSLAYRRTHPQPETEVELKKDLEGYYCADCCETFGKDRLDVPSECPSCNRYLVDFTFIDNLLLVIRKELEADFETYFDVPQTPPGWEITEENRWKG